MFILPGVGGRKQLLWPFVSDEKSAYINFILLGLRAVEGKCGLNCP